MIVRTLFVLLIWAPGCPGLPGMPGSPDPSTSGPLQPARPNDVTLYGTNDGGLPKTWGGGGAKLATTGGGGPGLLLELHCACAAAGAMT
jgi:hypothetical protein